MILPYKSYYVTHNTNQYLKVYIFGDKAIVRELNDPIMGQYNNIWNLFTRYGVRIYWYKSWERNEPPNNTFFDDSILTDLENSLTRANYKQKMAIQKFNNDFEDKLNV